MECRNRETYSWALTGIQSIKGGRMTQREFESVEWLNMNMEGREGML
jgi:hypothetical protein